MYRATAHSLFSIRYPLTPLSLFHTRLDTIGNAGFSHDFACLRGERPPVLAAFDSFGSVKPSFKTMLSFLLAPILPALSSMIPNERKDKMKGLGRDIRVIAVDLLDKATKEKAALGTGEVDKSILGALGKGIPFFLRGHSAEAHIVRSESSKSNIHMSLDEIMAQVHTKPTYPYLICFLKGAF